MPGVSARTFITLTTPNFMGSGIAALFLPKELALPDERKSNLPADAEADYAHRYERPNRPIKKSRDARDDEAKLTENQKELGLGDDQKTEDMNEGGRGTFQ